MSSSGGLPRSSSTPLKDGIPPKELLDDLCSRFVLNVPKEDQQSFERILFLVEYAHWFYEDNSVENNPSLKSFTLKEFTSLNFTSYKVRVPVTGAIILDQTYERCVLVKGWKGTSWSFPRGKKNKDEEDDACAIREVLEETGFNVSKLINKDEYIEMTFGPQRVRLYIVGGVKDDTAFAPQTKKEISPPVAPKPDSPARALPVSSFSLLDSGIIPTSPIRNSDQLLACCPSPVDSRPLVPLFWWQEAMSLWKAKGSSSSGNNLVMTETPSTSNLASVSVPVSNSNNSLNKGPGQSFRNFQFDSGPILQAIETAFSRH
ncbi:hypothetical protein M8C21_026824, partial [Ambrosia artemisiifolia]